MANRVTNKQLKAQIEIINDMLGVTDTDIGSIRYAGAYGGHGVHRLTNNAGGESDLMGGYAPARETHRFLSGMIAGLRIARTPVVRHIVDDSICNDPPDTTTQGCHHGLVVYTG